MGNAGCVAGESIGFRTRCALPAGRGKGASKPARAGETRGKASAVARGACPGVDDSSGY